MATRPTTDDYLLHQLHRANQLANGYFTSAASRLSLRPRQLIILQLIDELDHPNQNTVTEASGIDRSTVAEVVGRLARLGLVRRVKSEKDSRSYVLSLTPEGGNTLAAGKRVALAVEERIEAELGEQAASQLRAALLVLLPPTSCHATWKTAPSAT